MEDRVKFGGRRLRFADVDARALERVHREFQAQDRLHRPNSISKIQSIFIDDQKLSVLDRHISDAVLYGTSAMQTSVVSEDPLAKFKDHELIMALLKRGYAAMKLPSDGGPPEVLRGKD